MFALMTMVALAAGSLSALSWHASRGTVEYRRDFRQASIWLLLVAVLAAIGMMVAPA